MELLLIGASFPEIQPLVAHMELVANMGTNYARFRYKDHELDVLICGFGAGVAACRVTHALLQKKYDKVLLTGLCYSFRDDPKVGEIVNVLDDQFGDLGMEQMGAFNTLFEIGVVADDEFPFHKGILENNDPFSGSVNALTKVTAITLNTLITSSERIRNLFYKFSPEVVTLEGAAVYYSCMQESVPCYQIRIVHDKLESIDNPMKMDHEKATVLCRYLEDILQEWYAIE